MAEASESRPIRVLVVCTANICRSPMAAGFLRAAGPHLEVRSAGFLRAGEPAARHAIEVMRDHGVDISGHVSSVVSQEDVRWADLIVVMERQHARDLVLEFPGAGDRIFTLRSLAEAVRRTPLRNGMDPETYVAMLDSLRDRSSFLGSGNDEIADPYGRSPRHFRRTAAELKMLTEELARALAR